MCTAIKAGQFPECTAHQVKPPSVLATELVDMFYKVWDWALSLPQGEFGQIQAVVLLCLDAVDCTPIVESGWFEVNYLKGLGRLSFSACTIDDYLITLCNGPPIDKWDPRPSAESWYTSGRQQRRILTKRKRKDKGCKRGPRAKVQPDREKLCRAVALCNLKTPMAGTQKRVF
uniref:Uncharacterized protein n=1 Tax=Eutreptiella gymnastica TaxID=73025 RepID=A0A7S1NVA4_9EUGL|mmetsp:Transcript_87985/g.153020  ORF Transcript_87985/g.153020 Transcript_87985/m.153020 type:complete len:173 (+) Transcript_87985:847-1365(+)